MLLVWLRCFSLSPSLSPFRFWVACLFTMLLMCFGSLGSWVACLFTILLVCFGSGCLGSLVFLQYFRCVLFPWGRGSLVFLEYFRCFLFPGVLGRLSFYNTFCVFWFWVSWVACLLTTLVIFVRLKCLIEESLRPDSSGGFDVSLVSFSSVL